MSISPVRLARSAAAVIDNKLNSILVKDARQAVQSRIVIGIIMLLVIINALVSVVYLVKLDPHDPRSEGMELFMTLNGLVMVAGMGIIPLYTAVRLSIERNSGNMDLLYITTITPGSIVRGKWLAASSLTLLVFSASAPFILLSFLLRGIDIATILMVLATGLLMSWFLNLTAIAAGCIRGKLMLRGIVMLVFFMMLWGGVTNIIGTWMLSIGSSMVFFSEWFNTIMTLSALLIISGLIYIFARAMLSPASSNRMLPMRLAMMITWLLSLGMFFITIFQSNAPEAIAAWMVMWFIVFVVAMISGSGEREDWLPRVRRRIPRNLLGRLGFYLISTGNGSGILWSLLMALATLLIGVAVYISVAGDNKYNFIDTFNDMVMVLGGILALTYCYIMLGIIVRRMFLRRSSSSLIPALALALHAVLTLLPVLLGYILSDGRMIDLHWWFGSAGLLFFDGHSAEQVQRAQALTMAFVVAPLLTLLNLPWWYAQFSRFCRYEPDDIADDPVDVVVPQDVEAVLAEAPALLSGAEAGPQTGEGR